jgi:group I intron endonuclease
MLIYKLTNTVNGKAYVGLTTRTVKHRFTQHCRADSVIGKAIRKYGKDSFTVETLAKADTLEELEELEIKYIAMYDTFKNGYNLTSGGESGKELSEETKQKMSESHKGDKNPMFGKKRTGDVKQRISEGNKGKKRTDEHKQRISEAHKNKNESELLKEYRQKTSKPVAQYDLEGRLLQIHKSINEAEKTIGGGRKSIRDVCNGKRNTAGGYIWLFI